MMANKLLKRAQSLPLNTIVIAILVILVLLVIIVFFTSNVGDAGDQLNENDASSCSLNNPVLSTLGYDDVQPLDDPEDSCPSGDGWSRAVGVPNCCVHK